jgi:hypothetical protein
MLLILIVIPLSRGSILGSANSYFCFWSQDAISWSIVIKNRKIRQPVSWGQLSSHGAVFEPGQGVSIFIYMDDPLSAIPELGSLSPGTTINVKLHSAGGMDYIKLIRLP